MTDPLIVGFHGVIGAGKDTAGAVLVRDYGFARVGFADLLKEEVARIMRRTMLAIVERDVGWWHRYCDWLERTGEFSGEPTMLAYALWHDRPPAVRALLQEWGTELRRAEDPDYWIRAWRGRIVGHPRVMVPDVRFRNEAQVIRDVGGYLVRVDRPGHVGAGHASETSLADWMDWDATLVNDGSIPDLEAQMVQWARGVLPCTDAE